MRENKVLATVNGKEIKESHLAELMQNMGPERAMQFYSEDGQKRLLDELINQELIFLDADESNLRDESAFKMLVKEMEETLLKQYALDKMLGALEVSDEDAEDFYNNNKEQFIADEKVSASHILVDSEEEINKVKEELDSKSFEDLATEYSSCPSKERGGDLGEFGRGQMVPEFEEAAFAMEVGAVSDVVKTQFGYHLIKLTGKTEKEQKSFDTVKENIKTQLVYVKQKEVYDARVEELKGKYKVEVK
ncbi:MAG: peptidylprolyl isomerase [Clostridia bacterium]|jgi:peptidyl-prolyl cis-trans isomerase C|nr:peptidylprolyl isomerase [Clostridia bacterium]